MYHLGICYGHNATVAVVKDGTLIFCQSEERLNRIKNSTGFPRLTLDHIYSHVCKPEDVSSATLFERSVYGYLHLKSHGFQAYQYGDFLAPSVRETSLRNWLGKTDFGWQISRARINRTERNKALQEEAESYFSRELGLDRSKICYLDHHTAHAYSAMPNVMGNGSTLILTLDGVGDWTCSTVRLVRDGKVSLLASTDHRHSLGYYYSAATALLGMKAGEHEFKVMGLAPYAKSNYYKPLTEKLNGLLDVSDSGQWVSRVNPRRLQEALEEIFRYQRFDNVAGAIQDLTERLILKWIRYWIKHTGVSNIAVAGGVFMNVKVCQRLAEVPEVERLFVVPSAADESTAIGCAVWGTLNREPGTPVKPLQDLYLGMEYSDVEVEKAILESEAHQRYLVREVGEIDVEVGRLLAQNKIVARCSQRMEFGARALGNRSILANPSCFENLQVINDAIKSRDFWMPFTPSILEEDMSRYIVNPKNLFAPYMCMTFDTTPEARRDLVAAIHPRDFTARPQCVMRGWNPAYHKIISSFKEHTGIGAVLNTSFNLHGEPNVCSPRDAIRTVDLSDLGYLAMGRFLLEKKVKHSAEAVPHRYR